MSQQAPSASAALGRPPGMRRNVFILAACQALFMTAYILGISTSALVGAALAPSKALATVPLALQFAAMMAAIVPASLLMKRLGRSAGFTLSAAVGVAGALVATGAILGGLFLLFCLATMLFGVFNAFAGFYRFAACDAADDEYRGRAISYVMAGGVIAAFAGPYLARAARDLIGAAEFAGSYAGLVPIYVAALILPFFLRMPKASQSQAASSGRSLREIARQPKFIVALLGAMLGFAVMLLVMTATPLAMKEHGHAFGQTAFVIQWHVLGMFAPSFFTGSLIKRFGVTTIMLIGTLLAFATVAVNVAGETGVAAFWLGLVFLGVAWNFLFIGGTALLTEAYRPEEKAKTQALNDFLVYTGVTVAIFSAGAVQNGFGWQILNLASVPFVALVLVSLLWLRTRREAEVPVPA